MAVPANGKGSSAGSCPAKFGRFTISREVAPAPGATGSSTSTSGSSPAASGPSSALDGANAAAAVQALLIQRLLAQGDQRANDPAMVPSLGGCDADEVESTTGAEAADPPVLSKLQDIMETQQMLFARTWDEIKDQVCRMMQNGNSGNPDMSHPLQVAWPNTPTSTHSSSSCTRTPPLTNAERILHPRRSRPVADLASNQSALSDKSGHSNGGAVAGQSVSCGSQASSGGFPAVQIASDMVQPDEINEREATLQNWSHLGSALQRVVAQNVDLEEKNVQLQQDLWRLKQQVQEARQALDAEVQRARNGVAPVAQANVSPRASAAAIAPVGGAGVTIAESSVDSAPSGRPPPLPRGPGGAVAGNASSVGGPGLAASASAPGQAQCVPSAPAAALKDSGHAAQAPGVPATESPTTAVLEDSEEPSPHRQRHAPRRQPPADGSWAEVSGGVRCASLGL